MLPMSTTFDIPGYTVQRSVGVCFGLIAVSLGFGRGISASFSGLTKGEVPQCTEAIEEARFHAITRMEQHALALGANAIVGMRLDSNEFVQYAEFVAYGTAVVIG